MKPPTFFALILLCSVSTFAQKTNQQITAQLKSLKADKQITVNYDASGRTTKLMLFGENFADAEARAAGLEAMNFGMAVDYPGEELKASPQELRLTFWVLSKKPRFSGSDRWITLPPIDLDLGVPQYASKPKSNMEYLNFVIDREYLLKIAYGSNVKFRLGSHEFTFTPEHLRAFRSFLAASEVK